MSSRAHRCPRWDVIVVGLGGIGSAACAELARRGARVLGIDRWHPPHDRGSSHGATRIIRRAYFEHPDYVPLVDRAYELWERLEAATERRLLTTCGLLQFGPPDGAVVPGILASVRRHGLDAELWSVEEARRHFPQFSVPPAWSAVWEPGAGFLAVEACVAAHLEVARRHRADFELGVAVDSVEANDASSGGVVRTERGDFSGDRLVLTPGPWAPQLLKSLGLPLQVVRKHLHWFDAPAQWSADEGFPTFLVETADGIFYGFPPIDARGLKVAEHSLRGNGGEDVVGDPATASRKVDREDFERVRGFVERVMPECRGRSTGHAVCFYTMTPDEHFIVDRHPRMERTWIAAGFSGHGFKFAPVIGEALADLAQNGKTSLPIGFLNVDRLLQRPR